MTLLERKTDKRPIRLLLVDDDDGMRRSLEKILRLKEFEVVTAEDGFRAIERARDSRPDCILMDIKMPDLDGVEAYRRISQDCPDTPVLFMTAYSRSALIDEANALGDQVFSKPLNIDSVIEQLLVSAADRPLLIVDDDEGFSASLRKVLQAKGCEASEAKSVAEAVECFRRSPRSVVLLDMALGDGNGLDVLAELKAKNPEAAVVLCSGLPEMHPHMEECLGDSVQAFLTKPFEIDEMMEAIKAVS